MRVRMVAVIAAGAGVVLAGCGGDDSNGVADLEPTGILEEAQAAIDDAESVRIDGTITDEGTEIGLDLEYGVGVAGGSLTIDGVALEVLSADGNFYLMAGGEAWTLLADDPAAGALLADRWVLVPADDPSFSVFAEFADMSSLTAELLVLEGELTKGEETEIDGQSVIGLVDEDGSTLFIATTGDPLPVQFSAADGEDGSMSLEWGVEVDVTAPDESEVLDLTDLL